MLGQGQHVWPLLLAVREAVLDEVLHTREEKMRPVCVRNDSCMHTRAAYQPRRTVARRPVCCKRSGIISKRVGSPTCAACQPSRRADWSPRWVPRRAGLPSKREGFTAATLERAHTKRWQNAWCTNAGEESRSRRVRRRTRKRGKVTRYLPGRGESHNRERDPAVVRPTTHTPWHRC